MDTVAELVARALRELVAAAGIGGSHVVVIGASTSEVLGRRIGTAGALDVAEQIVAGVDRVRSEAGFVPAYQCCEHLNRALVVERTALEQRGWTEVAAVPAPTAGGAVATYVYRHTDGACLAETVQAHAGIDIGDTLIGMHLRRVAVPFRSAVRRIGEAHVTLAYTRPPYIGGERAVYR